MNREQHRQIIELSGITKRYFEGTSNEFAALSQITLQIFEGEFVAVVGASGSGKSTLMNIIGALDRASSGSYILDGTDVGKADDRALSHIRNEKVGFVFQTYNLIPRRDALKNVEMPMLYAGIGKSKRTARAKELLEILEMSDRMHHTPDELSGGQKQRVAIARAMANDPAILLADEPTGALDSKTGRLIMDVFHKLNREQGKTVLLITHSEELAEEAGEDHYPQRRRDHNGTKGEQKAMMFLENLSLALAALKSNKMRAFLTMLGIIIGIGSVITIMTLGDSLTASVTDSMQSMGANNVMVSLQQKSDEEEDKGERHELRFNRRQSGARGVRLLYRRNAQCA